LWSPRDGVQPAGPCRADSPEHPRCAEVRNAGGLDGGSNATSASCALRGAFLAWHPGFAARRPCVIGRPVYVSPLSTLGSLPDMIRFPRLPVLAGLLVAASILVGPLSAFAQESAGAGA